MSPLLSRVCLPGKNDLNLIVNISPVDGFEIVHVEIATFFDGIFTFVTTCAPLLITHG